MKKISRTVPLNDDRKVKQLRRLCKTYGLQGLTVRKSELVKKVKEYQAARKIQLFFFHKISKHQPRCSICLLKLITPWCKLEGHRYHCECLIQFFNAVGKMVDPVLKRKVPRKIVNQLNEIATLFGFAPIHFDVDKLLREKFEEEREQSVIRALEFTIQDMQRERVYVPHSQNFELLVNFLFSINTESALFFVDSMLEITKDDKQFSFQIRLSHYLKDKLLALKKIMAREREEIENVQKIYRENYLQFDYLVTAQESTNDFLWRLGDNLHYIEPNIPSIQPNNFIPQMSLALSQPLLPPPPPNTPNRPASVGDDVNIVFPFEREVPLINPRFLAWTLAALSEASLNH